MPYLSSSYRGVTMPQSEHPLLRKSLHWLTAETLALLMKPISQALLVRAAVVPTAEQILNGLLRHLSGMTGHVDAIEIHWRHPTCRIRGLHLAATNATSMLQDFTLASGDLHIHWSDLLHKKWV